MRLASSGARLRATATERLDAWGAIWRLSVEVGDLVVYVDSAAACAIPVLVVELFDGGAVVLNEHGTHEIPDDYLSEMTDEMKELIDASR
tara:strand:+ start:132 stop:401 length:270 start_codon:yes stop_codon:yes gene_type:complete